MNLEDGFARLFRCDRDMIAEAGNLLLLGFYAHLLCAARWKGGTFRGSHLQPGQLTTTRKSLADETGLTEKQVRGFIAKLQTLGLIRADQRANRFTILTLHHFNGCDDGEKLQGPTGGPTTGQPKADRGPTYADLSNTASELAVPKKEEGKMKKERPTDPRVATLGDLISKAYHQATGHTLRPQGQMRKDVAAYLRDGRTQEEILAAYEVFLADLDPFFRDRAWGKFANWWVAHPTRVAAQDEPQTGFRRTR